MAAQRHKAGRPPVPTGAPAHFKLRARPEHHIMQANGLGRRFGAPKRCARVEAAPRPCGDSTMTCDDPTLSCRSCGDSTIAFRRPDTLACGDPSVAGGDPTIAFGGTSLACGEPTPAPEPTWRRLCRGRSEPEQRLSLPKLQPLGARLAERPPSGGRRPSRTERLPSGARASTRRRPSDIRAASNRCLGGAEAVQRPSGAVRCPSGALERRRNEPCTRPLRRSDTDLGASLLWAARGRRAPCRRQNGRTAEVRPPRARAAEWRATGGPLCPLWHGLSPEAITCSDMLDTCRMRQLEQVRGRAHPRMRARGP